MEEEIKMVEEFLNILKDEETGVFIQREIFVLTEQLQAIENVLLKLKQLEEDNKTIRKSREYYKLLAYTNFGRDFGIKYIEDNFILGKKGICSDCGKEGTYCYEPYYAELHNEKYLMCLCEDCEHERYQNV